MARLPTLLVLLFGAIGASGAREPAQAPAATAAADDAPLIVRATCASCHAVRAGEISPLAQAPAFVEIANRPGLTRETLTAFLADSHNYPDQMDVDLDEQDVAAIAAYLVTLQRDDYKLPPS